MTGPVFPANLAQWFTSSGTEHRRRKGITTQEDSLISCTPFQKAAKAVCREEQTRLPCLVTYPFARTLQCLTVARMTPELAKCVAACAFIAWLTPRDTMNENSVRCLSVASTRKGCIAPLNIPLPTVPRTQRGQTVGRLRIRDLLPQARKIARIRLWGHANLSGMGRLHRLSNPKQRNDRSSWDGLQIDLFARTQCPRYLDWYF